MRTPSSAIAKKRLALAQRLRAARTEAGLSQAQVAKRLRKSQSYISRCEAGLRRLDIIELEEFCHLYRKPLAFFVEE